MVRSNCSYVMSRSVNAEVELSPGRYHILMKVTAYRCSDVATEDVVSRVAPVGREKLVQIGLSYDLAHAKGLVFESEKEKRAREDREARRKAAERRKLRKQTKRRLQKEWIRQRKLDGRRQRKAGRLSAKSSAESSRSTAQILPDDGPVQSPLDMDYSPSIGLDMKQIGRAHV